MHKNIIAEKKYYDDDEHFSAQHMRYFLTLPLQVTLRQGIPNEEITELLETEYIL